MVSKSFSLGYSGLSVQQITVEVDVARGLPAISLCGLADTALKESRQRIRSAIKNSGFDFPSRRITINLAPASVKKEGTHFDLSIALGIISASRQVKFDFSSYFILGELSLEGYVQAVKGVFPMALRAKEENKKLILPLANAKEAGLVRGLNVYPVENLAESVSLLSGTSSKKTFSLNWQDFKTTDPFYPVDFSEVRGQFFARRALEIAASGMHNIILIGPPGVGKTMLARRLPTILPNMEFEEVMELTKIYSISGLISKDNPLVKARPYRSPHHTSSSVALVGGGSNVRPGEASLAHQGVLFLDELPEFNRAALEALRQPLEDGFLNISRANKQARFPSRFLFAAAMNPCPCGYFGSQSKNCHCSSFQIQKYRNKISGPLLDRIDIHVELSEIRTKDLLSAKHEAESSSQIKMRVEQARIIQRDRFKKEGIFFNSQMTQRQIRKFCPLDKETEGILEVAIKHFNFSARSFDKILKVSRTIADLAQRDKIGSQDIAEVINYRSMDKRLWV